MRVREWAGRPRKGWPSDGIHVHWRVTKGHFNRDYLDSFNHKSMLYPSQAFLFQRVRHSQQPEQTSKSSRLALGKGQVFSPGNGPLVDPGIAVLSLSFLCWNCPCLPGGRRHLKIVPHVSLMYRELVCPCSLTAA